MSFSYNFWEKTYPLMNLQWYDLSSYPFKSRTICFFRANTILIYCVINTFFSIYYVITTHTITISCNIQKCNGAWLFASCMIAAATAYNYIERTFFNNFLFSLKVSPIHFRALSSSLFIVHIPFFFFERYFLFIF